MQNIIELKNISYKYPETELHNYDYYLQVDEQSHFLTDS